MNKCAFEFDSNLFACGLCYRKRDGVTSHGIVIEISPAPTNFRIVEHPNAYHHS